MWGFGICGLPITTVYMCRLLGPLSEAHGFTFPRICVCVASYLEADVVTVYLDALGEDFITAVIEVRRAGSLHRTSVSAVFTELNDLNGIGLYVDDLIEVNIGLVITPAGIKDIIDLDGVGLRYSGKIILGGYDSGVAVLFSLAIDMTSLAGDFINQEG